MEARRKKASTGVQRANHCSTPRLPIAVVMEILSRLPIRTLMAAKCVCKSWRELISGDTHFAKLHLSRSSTELLYQSATNESASTVLSLGNIDFHSNSVSTSISSPIFDLPNLRGNTKTSNEIFYVNTCNGLVCFSNDYHAPRTYAMICNPVTGEFINVDGPKKEKKGVECYGYVLGFSRKANRYKVLRVLKRKKKSVTRETSYEQFVEICTLEKGSSWRHLGDCPYLMGEVESNDFVFLEGKVHFLTEHSSIIACFDFDREQFQQVPLPPLPTDDTFKDEGGMGRIGVFEGCLFINIFRNMYLSELWVMKVYDVKESWTKVFTYPCRHFDRHVMINRTDAIPLKYLGNGDTLMLEHIQLVSYNPVTGCTHVDSIKDLRVIAYRPSLLRLKDALMGYDVFVLNAKPRGREQGCEGSDTEQLFTEEEVQQLEQKMEEYVARGIEEMEEYVAKEMTEEKMARRIEEMEEYVARRTEEIEEEYARCTEEIEEKYARCTEEIEEKYARCTEEIEEEYARRTEKIEEEYARRIGEMEANSTDPDSTV